MLPMLVHYCDNCSYNTPVEYSSTAWIEEQACNYCGVRSLGADTAGQSKGAMNSAQHDELAQLFAQNMHVSHVPQHQPPVQQFVQVSEKQPEQPAPIHFISSHYTQSAHIRAETQSEPSRSPPPPYNETFIPEAMAQILLQNSIDPNALLPNQIELFRNADYEQRLRLLELWRISPPSYPQRSLQPVPTSVEREEVEARARYEEQMRMQARAFNRHQAEMEDTHVPLHHLSSAGDAEPYMLNGYGAVSQRAIDPVYAAGGLWQAPSYAAKEQGIGMEDQYGMYEQIRNHADWERMNGQRFGGDDEMVM
ncbi:uncharacterized protein RCC_04202 [Ramularia collo-cygni]|uniref:Uncharacterized protein n=1 Tax=Ramularia collo-cygni TaxID=112498 RepID=A0A2D3UTN1_9PEZI|nr:uncharacterized protein RCC_04202 [Ramularia collo-cygni]CZT18358.1 uncharacterized protein RCC_04202 [Ramularia collo-cygni]